MQVVRPKNRTSTNFPGPELLPQKWVTPENLLWKTGDATPKADLVQMFWSGIVVRKIGRPGKFARGYYLPYSLENKKRAEGFFS